jgi:anti-anti-sigma factor
MTEGLEIRQRDGVAVARIAGEFDISRSAPIRDELLGAIENTDLGLVVDLTGATYVDSAGINVLFEVSERLTGRQQRVVAVLPDRAVIRRVVQLVNLGSVLGISETVDEALTQIYSDGK